MLTEMQQVRRCDGGVRGQGCVGECVFHEAGLWGVLSWAGVVCGLHFCGNSLGETRVFVQVSREKKKNALNHPSTGLFEREQREA